MAYRATPQTSTGLTPNFMMFGRELAMPVDIMIGPSLDTPTNFCLPIIWKVASATLPPRAGALPAISSVESVRTHLQHALIQTNQLYTHSCWCSAGLNPQYPCVTTSDIRTPPHTQKHYNTHPYESHEYWLCLNSMHDC